MKTSDRLPIQPTYKDASGVLRFRENKVVSALLSESQNRGFGLNELARLDIPDTDREQFAQLIGYSLSGFSDLSYVTDETIETATKISETGASEQ